MWQVGFWKGGTRQGQSERREGNQCCALKTDRDHSAKQAKDWDVSGWCPGLPQGSCIKQAPQSPAPGPPHPISWGHPDLATNLFAGTAQQDLGSGHIHCLHLDEPVLWRVILGVSRALGVPRPRRIRLQAGSTACAGPGQDRLPGYRNGSAANMLAVCERLPRQGCLSFSAPKCWAKSEASSILPSVLQMGKLLFPLATPSVVHSLWRSVSASRRKSS